MAGYLGSTPVPQATQHRESFTCTEGQTSFATAGYTPQFLDVFLNGSHLSPADFVATNSSDVVLVVAASADDVCDIVSYTPFEVAGATFTGTTTMDVVAIGGATTIATDKKLIFRDSAIHISSTADGDLSIAADDEIDITSTLIDINGAVDMSSTLKVAGNVAFGGQAPSGTGLTVKANGTGYTNGALELLAADGNSKSYITNVANLLALSDGDGTADAMIINAAGAVTKANQPAFQGQAEALNNIPANSANQTITFSEIFDQGGNFASNTFTAPVTGKYQINVHVLLENIDSAANYYQLQLITGNRIYYETVDADYGQDNSYLAVQIAVLADMDVGDTAVVAVHQNGGTAQTDVNTTTSKFSGFLAC